MQSFVADRPACADLPAFALQLLFRLCPQWHRFPVAVVSREAAQGEVLLACRRARQRGVLPGLTFAAALGLCPDLRAKTVSQADMDAAKADVVEQLRAFSPNIEADQGASGAFWLDASGVEPLFPSLEAWAQGIRERLGRCGFNAVVVIGFSRFSTFVLARGSGLETMVLPDPETEAVAVRAVLLDRLELSPWITRELRKLGKTTVGDLLHLPAGGVLERYGPLVHRLRSVAAGTCKDFMVPAVEKEPPAAGLILDAPEVDAIRLTFYVKRILGSLLSQIAGRHEALLALRIELLADREEPVVEHIRPAQPTLDEAQLMDLIRLRLENTPLPAGVGEIRLRASTVQAAMTQLPLFQRRPRRDLKAADRALARLRTEFGPQAVVRLKLEEGHLPEARFSFEPLEHMKPAQATGLMGPMDQGDRRTLVRRIWARPVPLQVYSVGDAKNFCVREGASYGTSYGAGDKTGGTFQNVRGPYILSGGWWRQEIHREYYFAQNEQGRVLWIYWDGRRGRWYQHGEVE